MMMNSINYKFVGNNSNCQKQKSLSLCTQKLDSVSFSGNKSDLKSVIPYRLESKLQDDFHSTSQQIYIRTYLEYKNQGLSDEEIAKKMFQKTFESDENEEAKKEVLNFVQKIGNKIADIDNSFKTVIPSLAPKTYYRGVIGDNKNRAISVINDAKVGDVIQPDLGYPFLASKKEYAESYSSYTNGKSNPENCVVMIVKTPAGTPISRDVKFNLLSLDNNVVLPRGVKYEVLDKEVKNDKTYITLKYLSCATDEEQ